MGPFTTLFRFISVSFFFLLFTTLVIASPSLSPENRTSIQERDGVRTTENGLSTDKCKLVTLIYAKGTTEVGNVGPYIGPAFIESLRGLLGSSRLTVQGVAYKASVEGFMTGGDLDGSTQMLSLIQTAAMKCPSTQLVLGGYSQGAQLVHNAAAQLSTDIISRITAVVLFGDPEIGQSVGPMVATDPHIKSICHPDDIVCAKFGGLRAHFTYTEDAYMAATFVIGQAGLMD